MVNIQAFLAVTQLQPPGILAGPDAVAPALVGKGVVLFLGREAGRMQLALESWMWNSQAGRRLSHRIGKGGSQSGLGCAPVLCSSTF